MFFRCFYSKGTNWYHFSCMETIFATQELVEVLSLVAPVETLKCNTFWVERLPGCILGKENIPDIWTHTTDKLKRSLVKVHHVPSA